MTCRGTDYELPFECPLDFLVSVRNLDQNNVQYRPAGFLQLPQVQYPQAEPPWHGTRGAGCVLQQHAIHSAPWKCMWQQRHLSAGQANLAWLHVHDGHEIGAALSGPCAAGDKQQAAYALYPATLSPVPKVAACSHGRPSEGG